MRILVIRLGAMGDLIHVSPTLAYLQSRIAGVRIDFVTSPLYAELVKHFEVNHVYTWDKEWDSMFALGRQLSQQHYDAVVNLHPSLKTWILSFLVRARYGSVYRKEKLQITGEKQRSIPRRHAIQDFYRPFKQLIKLEFESFKTNFPLEENPPLAPNLTLPHMPVREKNLVGIIPGVGGKRGNRAWLPEQYEKLLGDILAQTPELKFVLIGGPEEAGLANRLAAIDPNRIENACGVGSILETAQRLTRCAVVLGGDTGPLHLAAAVGTPVVQLFAPTSTKRTGAVSVAPVTTITPPDTLTCWPCEQPVCPLNGEDHMACMRQIEVTSVAKKLYSALNTAFEKS